MDRVQEQASIGVTNLSKKYVELLLNYLRVVDEAPEASGGRATWMKLLQRTNVSKLFTLELVFASARRGYIQAWATQNRQALTRIIRQEIHPFPSLWQWAFRNDARPAADEPLTTRKKLQQRSRSLSVNLPLKPLIKGTHTSRGDNLAHFCLVAACTLGRGQAS